ncbi:MAG: helix-hairpin-helix domain-containing protein, partial [Bacteroidales bacterium]|nr:helix-hairpin-helix domain-containing protein [Bacteroidales bacterium]
GKLLHHDVIHLSDLSNAKNKLQFLANQFAIEAIAIGDGTASRETLQAVHEISFHNNPIISMVNEDGASVYSASEIAREELGEYDITVRGAASIGRRLQDPLAELVKIDPKSIGVGQYQHDVNQTLLQSSLNMQVESCVNNVGVELNTASKKLLSYVSGIGETLAGNIIDYRNANGAFKSRKELLKVKRFGQKAFEQSAGFLRVRASKNPLDNTAVHPERYALVEQMAKDINCTVSDLINSLTHRSKIKLNQYISNDCGLPTLNDIMEELNRNSRDIRTKFEEKEFNNGVRCLEQLTVGQWLCGKVSNITAFGAFIDLGIHTDGLLHISSISKEYIGSVSEILSLGQEVKVRVSEIDYTRKRISLSMLSEDKPKKHSNI